MEEECGSDAAAFEDKVVRLTVAPSAESRGCDIESGKLKMQYTCILDSLKFLRCDMEIDNAIEFCKLNSFLFWNFSCVK